MEGNDVLHKCVDCTRGKTRVASCLLSLFHTIKRHGDVGDAPPSSLVDGVFSIRPAAICRHTQKNSSYIGVDSAQFIIYLCRLHGNPCGRKFWHPLGKAEFSMYLLQVVIHYYMLRVYYFQWRKMLWKFAASRVCSFVLSTSLWSYSKGSEVR